MNFKKRLVSLGPGLLFAGAAIGVSHLVQSTRAGADFGWGLLWVILVAHLFKYPFFQFGTRYAAATGESLLDGYRRLGKGFLVAYFCLNLATMLTIQAAVTIVTAGLAVELLGFSGHVVLWSVIITLIGLTILLWGRFKMLDKLMKLIVILLTLSTIVAVSIALINNDTPVNLQQILPQNALEISFLIAFLGWMPAPLDVSVWQSLWSLEKEKNTSQKIEVKQALYDFNIGYVSTFVLGICFLSMGALVMYHSGNSFSNKAGDFAKQLIQLYTQNLGDFSGIFIGIAAFTTMFSTTLTTLDASPRAMSKTSQLLWGKTQLNYRFWIILLALGTWIILQFFISNMMFMVKVATILSFLTAPFFAVSNYILVTQHIPQEHRPGKGLRLLSFLGILFLIGFSAWYLFVLI